VILITGGLGFIGSHTAVEALRAGHEVVIIDNLCNSRIEVLDGIRRAASGRVEFEKGDCRETSRVRALMQKFKVTAIIHFAALKSVAESIARPLDYYSNNIDGLISVLDAAGNEGIARFIFSSSASVYGTPKALPVTEEHPTSLDNTPYGITKLVAEKIITDYVRSHPQMRAVLLRYFNPIGADASGEIGEYPQGTPNNLMPYLMQVAAGKRDRLTIFGDDYVTPDGTCMRDFMHVTDLAIAHLKALEWLKGQKPALPSAFNLGLGHGQSVRELVREFEAASGLRIPVDVGPRRMGDTAALYADVSLAENVLGWKATRSFADAMRDSWLWAQKLQSI